MIKSLFISLIRSRRVAFAITGNGLISVSSLALSISIARSSSVITFGAFSFAMVAYLFSTGLIGAAFTNSALSRPEDNEILMRSFRRASLVSLIIGAFLLVGGLWASNLFLVTLGCCIHGLLLLSFSRIFDSAAGSPRRSVVLTTGWSFLSLSISILSFFSPIDPIKIFLIWALTGSVCGYLSALLSRKSFLPHWQSHSADTRTSIIFTADYLLGSGGSQLTNALIGLLGDTKMLGGIRAAGTLLGPVNMLSTTARSLMLPYLARGRKDPKQQFRSAIALVIVQTAITAPILLILQFIPDNIGTALLGATWPLATLAILPMSIDSLFSVVTTPAIAAHRVALAGKRTLFLRILTGVPRPFIVLFCAYTWGISGAAWAMAGMSFISAVLWWISYAKLRKHPID